MGARPRARRRIPVVDAVPRARIGPGGDGYQPRRRPCRGRRRRSAAGMRGTARRAAWRIDTWPGDLGGGAVVRTERRLPRLHGALIGEHLPSSALVAFTHTTPDTPHGSFRRSTCRYHSAVEVDRAVVTRSRVREPEHDEGAAARAPEQPAAEGLQVLRFGYHAARRAGDHVCGRPERLG